MSNKKKPRGPRFVVEDRGPWSVAPAPSLPGPTASSSVPEPMREVDVVPPPYRVTPVNTGKVKIGVYWAPKPARLTPEDEFWQKVFLGVKPGLDDWVSRFVNKSPWYLVGMVFLVAFLASLIKGCAV